MTIDLRHYDPSPENKGSDRSLKKPHPIQIAIAVLFFIAGLAFWLASPRETLVCDVDEWQVMEEPDDSSGAESITFTRGNQNHYFRENRHDGNILIITGMVRNSYPHKRSFIRLRGHLLAADGRSLAERYIYAGNILSEEDLINLPVMDIRARLSIKGGQDGRNLNVEPGVEIPFMLVFDRLPDGMTEYRIDPVGSVQAAGAPEQGKKSDIIDLPEESQESYYLDNKHGGKILVITGRAHNHYDHSRQFIRLRGHLLAADGRSLAERYFYAGNILTEEDLKHLPLAEIGARLNLRDGQEGRNMDIEPGGEIPFMLVFDKLPDGMTDYRVDLADSARADRGPSQGPKRSRP